MIPNKSLVAIASGFVAWLALAGGAAEPAAADRLAGMSEAGHFRVTAHSDLMPIPINRMHSWLLHVETAAGAAVLDAQIEVAGGMPAHDHGLPTAPTVTKNLNNGDYLLEGIKFHMNGRWEITVTLDAGGQRDLVVLTLDL